VILNNEIPCFPPVIARKRQDGIRSQPTRKNRPRYRYADNAIQPWNGRQAHRDPLPAGTWETFSTHDNRTGAILPDNFGREGAGRGVRFLGDYHTLRSGAAEAHGITSASMALWFLDSPDRMDIVSCAGRDIHASFAPPPLSVASPSNPDSIPSAGHPRSGHHHHGGPAWSSERSTS
jgi:hypothetical protein